MLEGNFSDAQGQPPHSTDKETEDERGDRW